MNIERYPNAEAPVYNRWGELVYGSNVPSPTPFDGTRHSQPLPANVYTYRLRLNLQNVETTGTVTLVR